MRKINQEGLERLKQWEGFKGEAYKDIGGVWTIGYGHTSQAGAPIVEAGMRITEPEAEALLKRDIAPVEQFVEAVVKVPLTEEQFSALVSFVYNIGADAFAKSNALKKLNEGDYDALPSELLKWTKVKGKTVQGLIARRSAEIALWNKGSFVSSSFVIPEQGAKESFWMQTGFLALLASTLSGLFELAAKSSILQWSLAVCILCSAVWGSLYWYHHYQEKQL